jgi:hypothetical protein
MRAASDVGGRSYQEETVGGGKCAASGTGPVKLEWAAIHLIASCSEVNFPKWCTAPFGHAIRTRQISPSCTGDKTVRRSPVAFMTAFTLTECDYVRTDTVTDTGRFWGHQRVHRHILVPHSLGGSYPDWMLQDLAQRARTVYDMACATAIESINPWERLRAERDRQ